MPNKLKIAVIGERFYDRYYIGTSDRMSPEAPVPVVKITEEREFPGGAANVADALVRLGADIYTIYQDSPVPVKNRLMIGNQQVARWDERDKVEPPHPQADWKSNLISCSGVILSDYGKGMFTHSILAEINKLTYNLGIPIFIDTKQNPNKFAFFEDGIFFPNMKEYAEFSEQYNNIDTAIYKLGAAGMCHYKFGALQSSEQAFNPNAVSVIGAGDTVIANFAWHFIQHKNITQAMTWASKAAAFKVGNPFTQNPTIADVQSLLND